MSTQHAREADATGRVEAPATEAEGADSSQAGELVITVVDGLTDHGLDVGEPEWDEFHSLRIANAPGALCEVAIYDDGVATWEYRLGRTDRSDPMHITGIATGILGVDLAKSRSMLSGRFPEPTLQTIAGRALVESGLQVRLEVYKDDFFFEVSSEIEVTNPALPLRGSVRIADDNSIRWECQLKSPVAEADGIDAGEFTETIARVLTE